VKDQFDNWCTSVPRYSGLQHFSKPFHSLKSGSWQRIDIWGIIRTLAVNCTSNLGYSKDVRKTAAEVAFDEMVLGAVWVLCEFSQLVSPQIHSDQSLTALDYALKRFYKKKGAFWAQKMSKSAKVTVDKLLARECHQLLEQNIHQIYAAMQVQLYGAEKVTASKSRQFQVLLNRARQAATMWLDADWQRAIEQLELEIHHVTPAKWQLLNKLFQHHQPQLLDEVRTKTTGPRSTFPT